MQSGLPSFYFPLREDNSSTVSQPSFSTSNRQHFTLAGAVAFFLLQILGGHVGIPMILLTLRIAKGVRKHPMLVNFLVTWVIYSTSFCILLYIGRQFGPEPSPILCNIQASLIYGTALLTPTAGLSFVLNLWLSLRNVTENRSVISNHTIRNYLLMAGPYTVFMVVVGLTAAYGAVNLNQVSRNQYYFYCTINSKLVDFIPAIAAIILFTIIVFEGLIAFKLYQMHTAFVNMRSNSSPPRELIVRVGIFSVYSFLAIVACIAFWLETGAELPYIIQASLPTAAFLIFGTQRDLLEAWGVVRLWHTIRQKPKVVQVVEIPKPHPLLSS